VSICTGCSFYAGGFQTNAEAKIQLAKFIGRFNLLQSP